MPGRILVVDDDFDAREMIAALLETAGHEVVQARDGVEAFAAIARGPRPSLLILDMVMPWLNGVDFRRRQLCDPALAETPVLVLSGTRPSSNLLAQLELDDGDWIPKPCRPDELLRRVELELAG